MTQPETIVCKPTPWFLLRAAVMLLMFGVFAVLFYLDGSTGYRKKNEGYYIHKTFEKAGQEYGKKTSDGNLTPEAWKEFASAQTVDLPEDRSVLPATTQVPMPWPEILHDHERMKTQWNLLWQEYSKERQLDATPPEKPYDQKKIFEQWVVFWICLALTAVSAFFLLRTIRRSISADDEAVTTQEGKRIPYGDLKKMDLRKWDTKGLAFIEYEGASGTGKIRLDGLTYGGFKKDQGEPAEALMQKIRSKFSGEIVEYVTVDEDETPKEPTGEA